MMIINVKTNEIALVPAFCNLCYGRMLSMKESKHNTQKNAKMFLKRLVRSACVHDCPYKECHRTLVKVVNGRISGMYDVTDPAAKIAAKFSLGMQPNFVNFSSPLNYRWRTEF